MAIAAAGLAVVVGIVAVGWRNHGKSDTGGDRAGAENGGAGATPVLAGDAEQKTAAREDRRANSNKGAKGVEFATRMLEPLLQSKDGRLMIDYIPLQAGIQALSIDEVQAAVATLIGESRLTNEAFRIGLGASVLEIWLKTHKSDPEAVDAILAFMGEKAAGLQVNTPGLLCDDPLEEIATVNGPLAVQWFADHRGLWKAYGNLDDLRGQILAGMAKNPDDAMQQLDLLKPDSFKTVGRRLASEAVQQTKLKNVVEAFQHQHERMADNPKGAAELREGLLAGIMKSSSFLNPADLKSWFEEGDPSEPEQKMILQKVELYGRTKEIDQWMKVFSGRLDEGEIGQKISQVMSSWQKNQPGAQEAWIGNLEEGPVKEAAVKSYIAGVPDAAKAKAMAEGLPAGAFREEMVKAAAEKR